MIFNRHYNTFNNEHTFIYVMTNKYNNFSYEGSKALYNYLEQLEEDTGIQIEFDPVALRCEYTEYKNFEEFKEDYQDIKTLEQLRNETIVIMFNKTIEYTELEELNSFIIHNNFYWFK